MTQEFRTPMPLNPTSVEAEVNLYSERCVQMYMTPEAAQFVLDIMRTVGGDPHNSRRFYAESIQKALTRAGAIPTVDFEEASLNRGLSLSREAFSPIDFPHDAALYVREIE